MNPSLIGKIILCTMGAVYTPLYFYNLPGGGGQILDEYSTEIQNFHARQFFYNPVVLQPGKYYSCKLGRRWLRVILVKHDATESEISTIDLGGATIVSTDAIGHLPSHLHTPPLLATLIHLSGIKPYLNANWPWESATTLADLLAISLGNQILRMLTKH